MTPSLPDLIFQVTGVESAPLLAALHEEAFAGGEVWDTDSFTSLLGLPGTEALVVLKGNEPAGFILTRTVMDETEVLTLAVRPSFRRLGLGKSLVEQILPKGKIFLEVSISNNAAKKLYDRCGFIKAGHRRRYYRDGSDALVLVSTPSE